MGVIDWNRKPSPKSPEEIEWSKGSDEYFEQFGERLGLGYGGKYKKEVWDQDKNADIVL